MNSETFNLNYIYRKSKYSDALKNIVYSLNDSKVLIIFDLNNDVKSF